MTNNNEWDNRSYTSVNSKLAAKNNDELDKMEAALSAKGTVEVEDDSQGSTDDTTPASESATEKTKSSKASEPEEDHDEGEDKPSSTDKAKDSDEGELSDEEVSRLSKKAQKRFKDLVRRNKELEAAGKPASKVPGVEDETIKDVTPDLEIPKPISDEDVDFNVPLNEDGSVDVAALKQGLVAFRKTLVEGTKRITQDQFTLQRLTEMTRDDFKAVPQKYSQLRELNPDGTKNPDYDEVLTDKIAENYRNDFIKAKQSGKYLRYLTYVDNLMSIYSHAKQVALEAREAKLNKQQAEDIPGNNVLDERKTRTTESKVKEARNMKELEALEAEIGVVG